MNEKLKEVLEARGGDSLTMTCWYHALTAAARGEIPGFQLVPVEPTEKMRKAANAELKQEQEYFRSVRVEGDVFCGLAHTQVWSVMLTAYKEEQK